MKYNGFNMKHANSLLCTLMDKLFAFSEYENFQLLYTRPPEGTSYEAFVGAAEKLVYTSNNQVVCYVFFRLKNSQAHEQPVLSSIEIYSCNPYSAYWKAHVTDYSSPEGIVFEAFWIAATLMCFPGSPVYAGDLHTQLMSIIPAKYFSISSCVSLSGSNRICTHKSLSSFLYKGKGLLFASDFS